MPLPKPNPDEQEKEFVSRCMSNETMKKEYPDQKQRVAVCFSQYKRRKQANGGVEPNWDDCECGNTAIVLI
jgi:hypothetical protein